MTEEETILHTVLGQLAKHNIGVVGVDCDAEGSNAVASTAAAAAGVGSGGGGGRSSVTGFCASESTLRYLLELERERLFLGQFTKVYPSADGAYFESLLEYYHKLFGNRAAKEGSASHGEGGLGSLHLPSGTWALSKVLTGIEVERAARGTK